MHSQNLVLPEGEILATFPFLYDGIHGCPAVAILPPSYNFTPSIFQCMEDSFGHRAFDSFVVPGFAKRLSAESKTVLGTLDLSYEKHQIEEAIVFQHVDFHNQGRSTRFKSQIQEDVFHKGGLIASLKLLRKRYPKLNVRLAYARLVNDQTEIEICEVFECGRERLRMVTPFFFKNIAQCGVAFILCLDFRFRKEARICVRDSLHFPAFDIIGIPGAARSFLFNADLSWKAIKVAYEQHGCRTFVIAQHSDCGAYGGAGAFTDAIAEELHFHEQMDLFECELKKRYPDATVIKIYARLIDNRTKIQFVRC